jgi:hypothetical protein
VEWLRRPGALLITFIVTDVVIMLYTNTAGASINARQHELALQAAFTVLDVILVWLVWRGGLSGRIAWTLLLVEVFFTLGAMIFGNAFTAYDSALYVFFAAEAAILLTPAVRQHLRDQREPD